MSRATTSGSTQTYASGQQNYDYNTFFDVHSTSVHSHIFPVDNNFYRVQAFNLSGSETVTIEQVTNPGQSNQLIAPYSPVNGPVTLTTNRTSYIIERPGVYRLTLSGGGLGTVIVVGFQFAMENEASQDIADALYAILQITPCSLGAKVLRDQPPQTNVLGLDDANCIIDFPLPTTDPCALGALIPPDLTANNEVVSLDGETCLVHQQLVSSVAGNLIQLKPDGVYYGIAPPPNFANQYVSSSTGSDSNPGTILLPLQTIQKAISNLPDGTAGNIFLLAGDTFHTYPTATGDTINTLTFLQGAAQAQTLNINNRLIEIFPYNDTPINDIIAYNSAHATAYDAYIAQQTNFPIINVTISLSTDSSTDVVLGFIVGGLGRIRLNACMFVMGSSGGATPSYFHSGFVGNGDVLFQGGYVVLSEIPAIGNGSGAGQMNVTIEQTPVLLPTAFAFTPKYAILGNQILMVTSPPIAPGSLIVPALTYTNTGDTAEQTSAFATPPAGYDYVALGGTDYLPPSGAGASSLLWQNIVIYDHTTRSYRRVFTDIDIQ